MTSKLGIAVPIMLLQYYISVLLVVPTALVLKNNSANFTCLAYCYNSGLVPCLE